jgi:hypothetical protein
LILGGEASVYYSSATDNPNNPESYLATLKSLTGVQRKRLLEGLWVAGSNLVFDTWRDSYNTSTEIDGGGNVTMEARYVPGGGDIVWAVDDGYSGKYDKKTGLYTGRSHPRVFLIIQKRTDGAAKVLAEHYAIKKLHHEHIAEVLAYHDKMGWPAPKYAVRDRAAATLEGALRSFGIRVKYNQCPVDESIKVTREWMAADENGVRRILVHPRCRHLRYEMATYAYDANNNVIKEHDNGSDALRYFVWDEEWGVRTDVDVATFDDVARMDWREHSGDPKKNRNVIDFAVYGGNYGQE